MWHLTIEYYRGMDDMLNRRFGLFVIKQQSQAMAAIFEQPENCDTGACHPTYMEFHTS